MAVTIRPMQRADLTDLIALCREHAAYEGVSYVDDGQRSRLDEALFAAYPMLYGWVVADGAELAGYMTATRDYSTWTAGSFIHMDCLYLREAYRGLGLGKRLVQTLVAFTRDQRCREIQWQTPPDNRLGIAFYERIGARANEKRRYKLDLSVGMT